MGKRAKRVKGPPAEATARRVTCISDEGGRALARKIVRQCGFHVLVKARKSPLHQPNSGRSLG
jgi:hypothetical protein